MVSKVWEVMNDLEMVTAKIVSAREIIDTAAEAIQNHDYNRAETLAMAAYEFLGYYLEEFDAKFKLAWQETVVKPNNFDYTSTGEKKSWSDFWEKSYYPDEHKGSTVSSVQYTEEELNAMCDKAELEENHSKYYYDYTRNDLNRPNPFDKKKWVLPVQETKVVDTDETEYFVSFPQDLLEAANLKEGDAVHWIDNNDGSYTIHKSLKPLGMDEC